jgi:flotillin
MMGTIEYWQLALGLALAVFAAALLFAAAMARFLKRPSPSEAIIRIGRSSTDVFIGRAAWIVPVLHRAATMSLSTIGLTIRRAGHDALVTKDFISTNLCAEFYIRVEPAEEDVKKAARTIGIDEGHAGTDAIREKAQELLEPKLVGALRGVAAQSDFLALHVSREHFAQEVGKALREDLGRNGFTLESVTITELTQTPLSEMRADDIFGASGRETVTKTVVEKNIAVKRKVQEEAERTAEIAREREINVAQQDRLMREGKAREEEAAVKAELAKSEALETRDLQRQALIAVEKAKKEKAQQAAEIEKQKAMEAAQIDKQITVVNKEKERADADAGKLAALALREKAEQEVITVQRVSAAEREKRVAVVAAEQAAEQHRLAADVEAYKRTKEADASASQVRAAAEAKAEAARLEAQGASEAVKIKAQADADAASLQASSITKLAEAHWEEGVKEADVLAKKTGAQNQKSREILLQETALALIARAPEIVRELVKPAERISEFKVLQLGGLGEGQGGAAAQGGTSQLLGGALGPMMKTMLETSALLPVLKEAMRFGNAEVVQPALQKVREQVQLATADQAPREEGEAQPLWPVNGKGGGSQAAR